MKTAPQCSGRGRHFHFFGWQVITCLGLLLACNALEANPYKPWANGPPSADTHFPIGVWYQDINWAQQYADAGINTYVYLDGLWRVGDDKNSGLQYLRNAGVKLITDQNEWSGFANDPAIVGWMLPDEPDNAQPLTGGGYGPPFTPAEMHTRYNAIKAADSTRPVYQNYGQGVAYDGWVGRGVRTNHPEDYPEYINGGADIPSFDIYPANSTGAVQNQFWRVAYGVQRLVQWSNPAQPVWCCIETTQIDSTKGRKPTTTEMRAEVWMAVIHGARGINYFAHQISPFNASALRQDPDMMAAITRTNREIRDLAPALYRPSVTNLATLASLVPDTPFDDTGIPPEVARLGFVAKEFEGYYYLLAVGMRDRTMQATFDLAGFTGTKTALVIGENRTVDIVNGRLADTFVKYEAHLYRIEKPAAPPKLRVTESLWTPGSFFLRWNTDPNAAYRLSWSTNLQTWNALSGNYPSTDSTLTLAATVPESALAFTDRYFIRVEKE